MSFPTVPVPIDRDILLLWLLGILAIFIVYGVGAEIYTASKSKEELSKEERDGLPDGRYIVVTGVFVTVFAIIISTVIVNFSDQSAYNRYRDSVAQTLSKDYGVRLQGKDAVTDFIDGKIVRARYEDGKGVAVALLNGETAHPQVVRADSSPLPRIHRDREVEPTSSDGSTSASTATSKPSSSPAPKPEDSDQLLKIKTPSSPFLK